MLRKINSWIIKLTGIGLHKYKPARAATLHCKKKFGNKTIHYCEIGVWKGDNTKDTLQQLSINKAFLVDPYTAYVDKNASMGELKEVQNAKQVMLTTLQPFKNIITRIYKLSNDAVQDVPMCDFIYIDGNHEYEFVMHDLENYYSKIKPGGVLAGHDANLISVMSAVSDFCAKKGLRFEVGANCESVDWWINK